MRRTECQRIIEEGILPGEFFQEETICDFLVTIERKKIWAISLDLLIQFDRICRKHDLKYFLAFGSLLGVVRHNGFIPWDDDLDVCMPREDYEKFVVLAQNELPSPYFLQIPGLDNDYFFSFPKIRNSNTTCISSAFRYCKFNQGIALDIFVLDNCHLHLVEKNFKKVTNLVLENSTNMRRCNPHPSEKDIERMKSFEMRSSYEILAELETIYKEMNKKTSEYCMPSGLTIYTPQRMIYKWADVLDLINVDFYGHKVYLPQNAEAILITTYGKNYMQYPPIMERGTWHNSVLFNSDKPYDESLTKLLREEYEEYNQA